MKTYHLIIPLALLSSQLIAASPSNEQLNKSQREILIMNNILRASLNAEPGIKVSQMNGSYLAQQGYSFTISASGISGGSSGWRDFFKSPELDFIDSEVIVRSEQATVDLANEAYQIAMEALRQSTEKMREFAEQEREIEYQIREVERERRDLNLERRHAQQKQKEQAMKKDISKLDQTIAKLQQEKKDIRAKRNNVKDDLKSKTKEKQEKAVETRKQNIRTVTNSIANTLCDYGAGLKSLNNEHYVNFILKKAADDQQDLVVIFNKKMINQCVTGGIDAKQLLASAMTYHFS